MLSSCRPCLCPLTRFSRPSTRCRNYASTANATGSSRSFGFLALTALGGVSAAYFFLPDASRSAPTYEDTPISSSHFTPATLEQSETVGPNSKLLTVSVPPNLVPSAESTGFQPIWSVFIKDDDIQVERPYTPLEGIDSSGRMRFWIKRYPKGEVGRWLHSKLVGDKIEFRGPLSTWRWQNDIWDEVIMISGGTGITPFYQLFHSVIRNTSFSPRTRFTLLHSSVTPEELPPSDILGPLQEYSRLHPERLRLSVHVDAMPGKRQDVHVGRIGKPAIEEALKIDSETSWRWFGGKGAASQAPSRKVMFLVCGPDPMINAIAGPLGRNFSQGVVGGVLGVMGYGSQEVYKFS